MRLSASRGWVRSGRLTIEGVVASCGWCSGVQCIGGGAEHSEHVSPGTPRMGLPQLAHQTTEGPRADFWTLRPVGAVGSRLSEGLQASRLDHLGLDGTLLELGLQRLAEPELARSLRRLLQLG